MAEGEEKPTPTGCCPCCMSSRVDLSMAAIWSASPASPGRTSGRGTRNRAGRRCRAKARKAQSQTRTFAPMKKRAKSNQAATNARVAFLPDTGTRPGMTPSHASRFYTLCTIIPARHLENSRAKRDQRAMMASLLARASPPDAGLPGFPQRRRMATGSPFTVAEQLRLWTGLVPHRIPFRSRRGNHRGEAKGVYLTKQTTCTRLLWAQSLVRASGGRTTKCPLLAQPLKARLCWPDPGLKVWPGPEGLASSPISGLIIINSGMALWPVSVKKTGSGEFERGEARVPE